MLCKISLFGRFPAPFSNLQGLGEVTDGTPLNRDRESPESTSVFSDIMIDQVLANQRSKKPLEYSPLVIHSIVFAYPGTAKVQYRIATAIAVFGHLPTYH